MEKIELNMNNIYIKSVTPNRVRLKSDIFSLESNLNLVQEMLGLHDVRTNIKCKSIVVIYDKNTTIDEIISKISDKFHKKIEQSLAASHAVCGSDGVCLSCDKKTNTSPASFKRKLVEFGLLSAYSIYIFVAKNVFGVVIASTPFSLIALVSVVAALPLLRESLDDIKNKKFTLQTFMSSTLILAIFIGEATAAFEIIYILRGGMLLEEYIATRSKNEIKNLIELDIKKVYVLVDGVELETDIEDISLGDIVVSRSGEKIPVDGIIVDGEAQIDESLINGRSDSANKKNDDEVFAGTLCEAGRIYIRVDAIGEETYIARVMRDVEKSLKLKSPSEVQADILAQKLLKLGSVMTLGTLVLSGSFINAFSVMIIMSCPCSTILAASTAISAGIANGAKQGILIKGGESLERVSQSEVFCFDKTGTLTTGKPLVKEVITSKKITAKELMEYLAIAEYRNTHPIASAIVKHAKSMDIYIEQNADTLVLSGLGVKCKYGKKTILAGNKKLFLEQDISLRSFDKKANEFLEDGKTVVFVAVDAKVLGFVTLEHEVRAGTQKMIEDLRKKGVKHIALLTGDDERVAASFSKEFDFDRVYANQSPHDKAQTIVNLKKEYKNVVMVGDGVNDTLAMSKADVAISFAAGGSEAAIAISNIAITHSHPEDVVNLYDLSKKTLKVVDQNYWMGTSTNIIGAIFGAVGLLSPAAAGAIHIGHTTSIMANSSKLAIDNKS